MWFTLHRFLLSLLTVSTVRHPQGTSGREFFSPLKVVIFNNVQPSSPLSWQLSVSSPPSSSSSHHHKREPSSPPPSPSPPLLPQLAVLLCPATNRWSNIWHNLKTHCSQSPLAHLMWFCHKKGLKWKCYLYLSESNPDVSFHLSGTWLLWPKKYSFLL